MIIPAGSAQISLEPQPQLLPWFALKVRANGEPKVKQALELKGFEVFLPTQFECRRYSDRIKKVEAALFAGYLFCRFDPNHRLPVVITPGVEYVVSDSGALRPVEEDEINAVRCAVQSGAGIEQWPYLRTGDEVRVKFGAMAGLTGLLVRARGTDRLVISVHMLQRSISVEIDRTWVTPVRLPEVRQ